MIYIIQDNFIDLDKLECISEIFSVGGYYDFLYQVNGIQHRIAGNLDRDIIFNIRNSLLETWIKWNKGDV